MAVNRGRYHIQLKRTQLSPESNRIKNYGLVFGEPVYLKDVTNDPHDQRLILGPPPASGDTTTKISDCYAARLVAQKLADPDDSSKTVELIKQGTYFKNKTSDNIVNLTDDTANNIYPITKLSAIQTDNSFTLSELLLKKVSIDELSNVTFPSLGVDSEGIFVDDAVLPTPSGSGLPQSLVDIVNSKVSIDDDNGNAVVTDLAMGVDLVGVYVKIPDGAAENLNYIKNYIDMMLDNSINTRLLALEGNVYYLEELINNIGTIYVGPTPPANNSRLWIDTTTLTGGLKYCSNKTTNVWSHVPVAYT